MVKLPLTEATPSAAPEAATDLISPRKSASTATAAAACKVMPDKWACTALPTWLTAMAAPNAPAALPDTLPAKVRTVAASSACTVSDVAVPYSEPPDQVAVISSSSKLVVLEPVTAPLPLPPTAMPMDWMVAVDKACTCTAPPELMLLLTTSALTPLLLSALVAVRPKKLSANAAPPAAVPPPDTVPANDWMTELSSALTRTDDEDADCVTPLTCANTCEVMALVVLEPARATVPPPDMPAATDLMVPDDVAVTPKAPVARKVLSATRAVTSPPISLTATAAPMAAAPDPLMVPAKEKMSLSLSALTVNAPPLVACVTLVAWAFTLAVSWLVVKLPLTEAPLDAAPEAATDLISPRMSASTTTAGAAFSVMPVSVACTALPTWFTAMAAPNAPPPLPATLPASVRTVAESSACTVSDVAVPLSEPPDQVATMSSSSKLVVLEPDTAPLPPPATAMPMDSINPEDRACTCTAPPEFKLLLSTWALTPLLLSALVAVRPKKLSAKAAPPPAVPPPDTVPANDLMMELSSALTRKDEDAADCVTLLICASTCEVMALVVLEPAKALVPPPAKPAAIDPMLPDEVAST